METWVFLSLVGLVCVLLLLLWSAQRGRKVHLTFTRLDTLREGQKVNATTDAYGSASFAGRITMIGGVIDPATRTLVAEADVNNSDGRLRPGMFARVSISQ